MKTQVGRDVSHRLVTVENHCKTHAFCKKKISHSHQQNIRVNRQSAAPKRELSDSIAFLKVTVCPTGAELEALLKRNELFLQNVKFCLTKVGRNIEVALRAHRFA